MNAICPVPEYAKPCFLRHRSSSAFNLLAYATRPVLNGQFFQPLQLLLRLLLRLSFYAASFFVPSWQHPKIASCVPPIPLPPSLPPSGYLSGYLSSGRVANDALVGGTDTVRPTESRHPPLFLFEGGHLCAAMHGMGINLRYLPAVRYAFRTISVLWYIGITVFFLPLWPPVSFRALLYAIVWCVVETLLQCQVCKTTVDH